MAGRLLALHGLHSVRVNPSCQLFNQGKWSTILYIREYRSRSSTPLVVIGCKDRSSLQHHDSSSCKHQLNSISRLIQPARNLSKMAKKGGGKKGKQKSTLDALIDEIDSDEDEDDPKAETQREEFALKETPLSKFLATVKTTGGGKKGGGSINKLTYSEFINIVQGEALWTEYEECLGKLKQFYTLQLTVRSATSLDNLEVEFEGDMYPLCELATISKRDPKRLIIDASAFPQSITNIMAAIRNSGLNVNPQQEGLSVYVGIPKVTKEHREKLADGAKKKLTSVKQELRDVQNKYQKGIGELELSNKVSKDDARIAKDLVKVVGDHFSSLGDQMLHAKVKEVLGK